MIRPTLSVLAVLLGGLALVPAARAQTVIAPTVAQSGTAHASFSRADCLADPQLQLVFTWTYAVIQPGAREKIYLSKTDACSDADADSKQLIAERDVTQTSNQWPPAGSATTLTPRDFFDLFGPGCPADVEQTPVFCVKVTNSTFSNSTPAFGKSSVVVDSKPPPVPTAVTADPLDSGLVVGWTMPSDLQGATHYFVHVVSPDGKDHGAGVSGAAIRTASIDGLTNLTTYKVTVTSLDAAGTETSRNNESAPSAEVSGTPQPVDDFWALYKADGGKETGGCASTDASLLALGLAGLFALRRRRGAAAVLALAAALPGTASAQVSTPNYLHSPRHWTFSVKTGTYDPNIDDESGLTGKPFATVFDPNKSRYLWRAALDYDVFSGFGRVSLGLSGGFWQAVGKARLQSDPTKAAKDTVLLDLWPITPQATYRADFLYERWSIPLVPYVRVGYGFTHWNTFRKDNTTSQSGTSVGEGWARGIEYGAGLQAVLDAIEPDKAASLDQDFGINSTSLFVGWDGMQWEGAHGLLLHGSTVNFGLLLAF